MHLYPVPLMPCALVADDEPSVRSFFVDALRYHGVQAVEAADGAEAIDLIRRHTGRIDVAFLDLRMPRVDGRAALVALKGLRPTLPCHLMAGYASSEDAQALRAAGATSVLCKPITLAQLAACLPVPGRGVAPRNDRLSALLPRSVPAHTCCDLFIG
jgi:CheY-like chemotaxis protein